jgi:hypothetical protein
MAKKSKRSASKENLSTKEKASVDALAGNRPSGFNPDYHYVIKDLRRVGVLAGSFLVVLVALAIVLQL